jgi:lysophospholipase L1-like esterase
MRKKQLNLILIIWFCISALSFSSIAFYCSKTTFLKTTGFFLRGINFNEIGEIHSTGFNKNHKPVRDIYCLLQHRESEKYIYDDWRFDFKYYDLIDSIELSIPVKLLSKIEKVWYKYDKSVTCFSNKEFIEIWPHKEFGDTVCFLIPAKLKHKNSFYDGILCMIYMKGKLFKIIRYIMVISFFVGLILILIRFSFIIKLFSKCIYNSAHNIYIKYLGFFRRFFILVLGLFFAFFLLEVSLRFIGYIHNKRNIEKQYNKTVNTNNLIICIGDSFTESYGSSEGNDYPSQLERLINQKSEKKYTVLNFGRSGKNTAQIALEVPGYIKNYRPRLIVLMAGSANYWNYWGYQAKKSLFNSLRSVTFIKLIIQSIIKKEKKIEFLPEEYIERRDPNKIALQLKDTSDSPTLKIIRTHNTNIICRYADSCYRLGSLNEKDIINLLMFFKITRKNEIFETSLKNYIPKSTRAKFYFFLSGINSGKEPLNLSIFSPFYQSVYYYLEEMKVSKFSEKEMKKCIQLNPYFEDAYFQYYNLGNKKIAIPEDYNQKRFSIIDTINYYKILFNLHALNKAFVEETLEGNLEKQKIGQWVTRDIDKIIYLCKQNGVDIILMNYPIQYNSTLFYSVNDILKDIAAKNDIPFVDNGKVFDKITTDRESYFISDGHCSDKGYNLISHNLYKVIIDNRLLDTVFKKNAE